MTPANASLRQRIAGLQGQAGLWVTGKGGAEQHVAESVADQLVAAPLERGAASGEPRRKRYAAGALTRAGSGAVRRFAGGRFFRVAPRSSCTGRTIIGTPACCNRR
jgi:hypothetical protein